MEFLKGGTFYCNCENFQLDCGKITISIFYCHFRFVAVTMLLLANCEVHMTTYKDLRSENIPYGTNNWLMRALLCCCCERLEKFL